jgi:hypothetical protein
MDSSFGSIDQTLSEITDNQESLLSNEHGQITGSLPTNGVL